GTLDASGGDGLSRPAAGGGGRIALYGGTIGEGLLARTLASGGDADTPERRGAAGTIFVKRDAQGFGDLILDNAGRDTAQPTELLAVLPGVVDAVDATSLTDDHADFLHDVTGVEVFVNGDTSTLWPVTGHEHHGRTLALDTSAQALTALPGDAYQGLYRFDRVIVRGGAEAVTRSPVQSASAPEVEAGSSWVAGHQPTVTLTSPAQGQVFEGGEVVTLAAEVANLFGVVSVELSFGDESLDDASPPYSATFTAPPVTTPTEMEVTVVVRDRSGHEMRDSLTVTLEPNPDSLAPNVTLADCPRNGDRIVPGAALGLGFTVSDNELLESYRLLVDGAVLEEVTGVDQASLATSYAWTPPAGAAPGTVFTVRVEGRDYAGNVGAAQWSLSVPVGAILSGNQTLDGSHDGQDLTLGPGTFTVAEPIAPSSLTLASGAILTSPPGQPVDLDATGELRVQCGGLIDVTGQGYAGGTGAHPVGYAPAGVQGSGREYGGSHGGLGAVWSTSQTSDPQGEAYDSVYAPHLAGGGAGLDGDGAGDGLAGGGVVNITAGSVVLEGDIRADGLASNDAGRGGGAGGTVKIEATSLAGSGSITADGGWVRSCSSSRGIGTGGGGRVALRVTDLSGFDVAEQVQAWGAALYDCWWGIYRYASPGTLYVRT
ncbi:MAG TPA: Ig-like domain-containing protein, partial [Thermoanaerobaculia bacterium]|nr:Ig-like domain-containing protein [Thermoanaerobaculia bacterium]